MIGAATATTARALPRLASSGTRCSGTHKQSSAPTSVVVASSSSTRGFYRYCGVAAVVAAGTATFLDDDKDGDHQEQHSRSGKLQYHHHHRHPHNHEKHPAYYWESTSSTKASRQKAFYPVRSLLLVPSSLLISILPTSYTSCEEHPPNAPLATSEKTPSPESSSSESSKATTTPFNQEEEDFLNTIGLYQHWLKEIKKQWAISSPSSIRWPTNIPQKDEISALEVDLQNYRKNEGNSRLCQDLEFRIASYYLFRESDQEQQKKGFNLVKKLALDCHPDGLCLYAMIWNHGGVAGMEAQPQLAVKYWRQAASTGHLASMYELAVALYMGDGTVEDTAQAVRYFKKAADLGHSGAAYLLTDCYLDGVGIEQKNRAKALEWLMAAAEMGHRQAQRRAEALLTATPGGDESKGDTTLDKDESIRWGGTRPADWYRKVSLERRFSIGGGSRNPLILFKRRTSVAESRQSEE